MVGVTLFIQDSQFVGHFRTWMKTCLLSHGGFVNLWRELYPAVGGLAKYVEMELEFKYDMVNGRS